MPKQPTKKTVAKTTTKKTVPTAAPAPAERKTRGGGDQYANKVLPYLTDIERYTRCGVTEGQLCEFYGVGKTVWAEYKKKYPELTETLYKAKCALRTELVNKAYEVAVGYDYEETTIVTYYDKNGAIKSSKKTVARRHARADGGMIQFLLINRFADEFARDPQAIALRQKALELAERGVIPPENLEGV